MSARVSVVGANGRVGRAISDHLGARYRVVRIVRTSPDEDVRDVARRAVADHPDVVVNAAGVAHVEHANADDLARLERGNVELPAALAAAALAERIPMIHISSVKAADAQATSPYGWSKRRGDDRLEDEYAQQFVDAGIALVIVRPLALLFPPLDAGKVARLRFLRWWPGVLTPAIRLPVLAPATFLGVIAACVDDVLTSATRRGLSIRGFHVTEHGTLRDVRAAMRGLEWREVK